MQVWCLSYSWFHRCQNITFSGWFNEQHLVRFPCTVWSLYRFTVLAQLLTVMLLYCHVFVFGCNVDWWLMSDSLLKVSLKHWKQSKILHYCFITVTLACLTSVKTLTQVLYIEYDSLVIYLCMNRTPRQGVSWSVWKLQWQIIRQVVLKLPCCLRAGPSWILTPASQLTLL